MTPEFHAHVLSTPEASVLILSTAGVAILHTLAGPDHYLPFIVMDRARKWSTARTVFWTTLCGVGHVGSSVVLAIVGVLLGYGLERVQFFEGLRGNLAAWAMIAFGAAYLAWGLNRAVRPTTTVTRTTRREAMGTCTPTIPRLRTRTARPRASSSRPGCCSRSSSSGRASR